MHNPDCPWNKIHISEPINDPNGPDYYLSIHPDSLHFYNVHTDHPDDVYIQFNFCPICGQPLE